MIYKTMVEQKRNDEFRNEYNQSTGKFSKTEFKSLLFQRGFTGIYGWIIGYGSPPEKHLDILTITQNDYELGSIIEIKIIGVFIRNDKDNKFIGIEINRTEKDFNDLPFEDRNMLMKLYPVIKNGEGWFGYTTAAKLLKEYLK